MTFMRLFWGEHKLVCRRSNNSRIKRGREAPFLFDSIPKALLLHGFFFVFLRATQFKRCKPWMQQIEQRNKLTR